MPAATSRKTKSTYIPGNKVKLVRAGSSYFNQLHEMIAAAKESIHLQVYIFEDDETGRKVAEALMEAVKRKVEVYVVADAYASYSLPKQFVKNLEATGVHFRFFQPLFKSKYFYIGRRLHHKLFLVDAKYAMVGGINIGDRYNDTPEFKAWLDFALHVEGPIADELCLLAWKTWKSFPAQPGDIPCGKAPVPAMHQEDSSPVRMRRNDWVRTKNEISRTYKEMFTTASSHITILCSYFMPGNLVKKYILRAAKRGVKIRVIMAGRSDIALAKNAERFMYDWLLRNKVEIYEYGENVLHGKLAVCDSRWMTIGSYNINNISAYASIELNLDVKNSKFTKQVEGILDDVITSGCVHITQETERKTKNIFRQFIWWCSYEFIRVIFYLFTFYYRQREK